jgi:hypothetical protein
MEKNLLGHKRGKQTRGLGEIGLHVKKMKLLLLLIKIYY